MIEIFDVDKLPKRRLYIKKMFALDRYRAADVRAAIHEMQFNAARALAQTVIESENFFVLRTKRDGGIETTECFADCIILTSEEYLLMQQEAFRKGVDHAQDFAAVYVPNETPALKGE